MAIEPQQNVTIEQDRTNESRSDPGSIEKQSGEVNEAQREAAGRYQAALREAQELAAAAREQESIAQKAQQLSQDRPLEREGRER